VDDDNTIKEEQLRRKMKNLRRSFIPCSSRLVVIVLQGVPEQMVNFECIFFKRETKDAPRAKVVLRTTSKLHWDVVKNRVSTLKT
jgi:hypothetical protein